MAVWPVGFVIELGRREIGLWIEIGEVEVLRKTMRKRREDWERRRAVGGPGLATTLPPVEPSLH